MYDSIFSFFFYTNNLHLIPFCQSFYTSLASSRKKLYLYTSVTLFTQTLVLGRYPIAQKLIFQRENYCVNN